MPQPNEFCWSDEGISGKQLKSLYLKSDTKVSKIPFLINSITYNDYYLIYIKFILNNIQMSLESRLYKNWFQPAAIELFHCISMGFTGGSEGKESICSVGELGLMPGSERFPGEVNGYPEFLPGEFHWQRSLVGYSPRGCKESDITQQITLSLFPLCVCVCVCTYICMYSKLQSK